MLKIEKERNGALLVHWRCPNDDCFGSGYINPIRIKTLD